MENEDLQALEVIEPSVNPIESDSLSEVILDSTPTVDISDISVDGEDEFSHKDTLLSEFLDDPEKEKEESNEQTDLKKDIEEEEKATDTENVVEEVIEHTLQYDDLAFPEGISLDDKSVSEFKSIMGSHAIPKESAQKLMDMHTGVVQAIFKREQENQWKTWNEQQAQWREQALSDPEIGGSGHKTAMANIASIRDQYLKTKEDKQALGDFLTATGAGNSPIFLKWIYRISKDLLEAKPPKSQASPAPDRGPGPRNKASKLYDYSRSK